MRKKIAYYFVCSLVVLGFVACNQQSQNNIEPAVTPEVKPVPGKKYSKPKNKKPAVVSPAKTQPVVSTASAPADGAASPNETGSATISAAPARPADPVRLRPLGKRVSSVAVKGKYVALTFDDGPHASLTPKALSILNRHGAKGTFFMLGQNAARNRSIVAQAAAQGHEIGVHTWSHIKMNSSTRARVDSEVSRTQNLLAKISGTYPRVMRPPYGATNKALVEHMYNRYGMASVLWNVDTCDWRKPGVTAVINCAVNKAKPGSIILVHDIHASTLAALEGIVTGLQARGFQLVTVSELLQISKREAAEAAAAEAAAAAAVAAEAAAAEAAAAGAITPQEPQPEEPVPAVPEPPQPETPEIAPATATAPVMEPAAAEIRVAEEPLEQTTASEL